jgi:hypothetical protein
MFAFSLIAAFLALLIGALLPAPGTTVLKDFIVFFAGVGLAIALTSASARASSGDRINSVCTRSAERLQLTDYYARVTASKLRDSLQGDAVDLIATNLEHLADQARVSIGDLQEIASVTLPTPAPPTSAASTHAKCPYCSELVEATLANTPGQTANITCHQCSRVFSILRVIDGSIRSGRVARSKPATQKILCPNCRKRTIPFEVHSTRPVIRHCFTCNSRLEISPTGAVKSEMQSPLNAALQTSGDERVLVCPSCHARTPVRSTFTGPVLKATCINCFKLLMANQNGSDAQSVPVQPQV